MTLYNHSVVFSNELLETVIPFSPYDIFEQLIHDSDDEAMKKYNLKLIDLSVNKRIDVLDSLVTKVITEMMDIHREAINDNVIDIFLEKFTEYANRNINPERKINDPNTSRI